MAVKTKGITRCHVELLDHIKIHNTQCISRQHPVLNATIRVSFVSINFIDPVAALMKDLSSHV